MTQPKPKHEVFTISELRAEFIELSAMWLGFISLEEYDKADGTFKLIDDCLDMYNEKIEVYRPPVAEGTI